MKLRQFDSPEPLGEMEENERYFLSTPMPYDMTFHESQRLADKLMELIAIVEPRMSIEEAELVCEWDRCHGDMIYTLDARRAIPEHVANDPDRNRLIPRPYAERKNSRNR